MACEPDQTRWVGIRPTPDCNDIPTTTRKEAPAVSDLQAIKEVHTELLEIPGQNCTVEYAVSSLEVPLGEIWVINHITLRNKTSLCDMMVKVRRVAVYYPLAGWYSIPANTLKWWDGHIKLQAFERLRLYWRLGGAADTVNYYMRGYKIGLY